MSNFNKVLLMGRLTRDIELRYTPSNQAVANIGLAVNRRWRNKEGQDQEDTTFVDCEAWGRTAEVMNQYLAKGRPVFIEGRLKLDTWQDKEGGNRSKLKVVIDNFQFVDSRAGAGGGGGGGGGGGDGGGGGAPNAAPAHAGTGGGHQPVTEDDIPF